MGERTELVRKMAHRFDKLIALVEISEPKMSAEELADAHASLIELDGLLAEATKEARKKGWIE